MESLIKQSYDNIEIIIFDDASSDDTYLNLSEFVGKDARIRIIRHTVNVGFTKGLINAIAEAKGEYIAIHGSGDVSKPHRIERQVAEFENNAALAIVGCNAERVTVDGEFVELVDNARRNIEYPFLQGEIMYRRKYLEDVGGYRDFFVYGQATDLWQRLLQRYEYRIVDEVLYTHVLVPGTLSRDGRRLIERELMARYRSILFKERRRNGTDSLDRFGNLFYLHQPSSIMFEVGYLKSYLRSRIQYPGVARRLLLRSATGWLHLVLFPVYVLVSLVPRRVLSRFVRTTSVVRK